MSQSYAASVNWREEKFKSLYFSSWFVLDQKWASLFLLMVAGSVVLAVWQREGQTFFALVALIVLLASLWRLFVPVHFEINSEGITRWAIGQKRFIAWEDIRIYQVRRHGILLLPQHDRYLLEAFRGFYLPIPAPLMTEVLYRFRVFVDRITD